MTWGFVINVGKIVNYGKGDESDKSALFVNYKHRIITKLGTKVLPFRPFIKTLNFF
jgi:hypothetical protein